MRYHLLLETVSSHHLIPGSLKRSGHPVTEENQQAPSWPFAHFTQENRSTQLARGQLVLWAPCLWGRAPAARGYPSPLVQRNRSSSLQEDDSSQGLAGVRALTGSLPAGMISEAESLFLLSTAGTERANRGNVSPRDAREAARQQNLPRGCFRPSLQLISSFGGMTT